MVELLATMEGITSEAQEPARKRQKLSPPAHTNISHASPNTNSNTGNSLKMEATEPAKGNETRQLDREAQVGILHFVSPASSGFSGILKQRFV